ncbi:MAG: hypothetical protein H6713_33830 [Myxococcales bacterium]|nr:hypothetical protein [Myxococcales bacterium]
MKKLLTVIALLGIGVAAALLYTTTLSPEARVCRSIEARCGADTMPVSECREALEGATARELEELRRCAEPSESCVELLACLSGSVIRDVGRGLLRGLSGPR